MNHSHWSLRLRILASHIVAVGAGGLTALIAGWLVASGPLSPDPAGGDLSPAQLPALIASVLAGTLAGGLVALFTSRWLFVHFVRPVRRMTNVVRRLAAGRYSERMAQPDVDAPHDEDLGRLATSIDLLAATLDDAERRRVLSFGEIAHEIRTPVAVLTGYLEGLLDGHIKSNPRTWALLHDEASRVHRLVDELQELSRAEARQAVTDLQAVEPGLIVESALERLMPHFREKGLEVSTDIQKGLPAVLADPDQALRALGNLLTNALRYTPAPGRVMVEASRLTGTQEVVFRVADTGVGIDAEHIPHLFERFFRVDRISSRKLGGSGIGLPVAKALVEAMGGRIWAESPGLGKGSAFHFTLLVTPNPRESHSQD